MAGIRIQQPVGEDWEYSLDGQTWQKQPLFSANPDGSAFVVGRSYPVQVRNLVLNQLGSGTIVFGALSNDGASTALDPARRYGRGTILKPGLRSFSDEFSDEFD